MAKKTPTYGEAAERLETILQQIEEGEVDLDALGALVSEAADLVELCRKKIEASELQVKQVTEKLERVDRDDRDDRDDGPDDSED